MKVITHSPQETAVFAAGWIKKISELNKKKTVIRPIGGAVVVGLYGDLGSGKTAFSQAVASTLSIEETVTSPTFVIEKIYQIHRQTTPFTHLIHIDAYRLEKSEELIRLGWNDIIANRANLILIEWPEKVADIMPTDHIRLKFTFIDETTREIEEKIGEVLQ